MPTITEAKRRLTGIKGHVAVAIWCREDVIEKGHELGVHISAKVAGDILDQVDERQDCEQGISWDTFDYYIQEWKEQHPHYRKYKKGLNNG